MPMKPFTLTPSRTGCAGRAQAGSAYVVVLLVLVVLTILGLSLVMVTQTERQIGVSEKTTQRTFSASETALGLAVAKALGADSTKPMSFQIREPRAPGELLRIRHDLESCMVFLLDAPANLTQINRGGSADTLYSEINHGLTASATRRGFTTDTAPANPAILAAQQISLMVEFQPRPPRTLELSDSIRANCPFDEVL